MEIKIKKKAPMPLFQKIFYVISAIFLLLAFIYLGTKDFQSSGRKISDNVTFAQEYNVTDQNIFVYKNTKDTLEFLNNGSGIIFFCFPENPWCSPYSEILNEVAKNKGFREIYYYNFKSARSSNNHSYLDMVRKLSDFLPVLDSGVQNIYAPTMVMIQEGNVIFYDNETSIIDGTMSPKDFWTNFKKNDKKHIFETMFDTYLSIVNYKEEEVNNEY